MRPVQTARARYLLCELALTDAGYAKYPGQPVRRCAGYQPASKDDENSDRPAPN
jgi:hypothetical protein